MLEKLFSKGTEKGSLVEIIGGHPEYIGKIDVVEGTYEELGKNNVPAVLLKKYGVYGIENIKKIKTTDIRMVYAKMLANYNLKLFEENVDVGNLLGFNYEEYWIFDPFTKAGTTEECDPIKEYGEAFINSPFFNPTDYIELKK